MPTKHHSDPPDPADLAALYREVQELIAVTLSSVSRLQELMGQLAAHLPVPEGASTAEAAPEAAPVPHVHVPLILLSGDTPEPEERLATNGILVTTGEPLLTIDLRAATKLARSDSDPSYHLHLARAEFNKHDDLGTVFGNENKIHEVGWALVVHADDDAELLWALSPLIEKRCADQGLPVPQLEFRPGETCGQWLRRRVADMNAPLQSKVPVLIYEDGEDANGWLARHGVPAGPVDPRRGVPFYLLLVGLPGPTAAQRCHIPFSVQYDLDIFWGVGRLCFTDPEDGQHDLDAYRAYAEQLVAFEQTPQPPRRHVVYFGTRHPLDRATELSATELIRPLYERGPALDKGFSQELFIDKDASRTNLHHILSGNERHGPPALLFTATHGAGFPVDDPRLAAHQGALICQDWGGSGAPRRDHWYAAEDLPDDISLAGLIAVCFGCYSAGCPQEEAFLPGIDQRRRVVAPYPLVAQLPQQLLARGALAVLGHVDRAWSHSFRSERVPAQIQRFESVLGKLMQGDRLGLATDQFNMVQGMLANTLNELLVKVRAGLQISPQELSSLWAARNDARNYALLGDPAARLPV
ncbi:MAG: hypothetical protein OHK0022_23120 [Roseiflexaceae bacterium]